MKQNQQLHGEIKIGQIAYKLLLTACGMYKKTTFLLCDNWGKHLRLVFYLLKSPTKTNNQILGGFHSKCDESKTKVKTDKAPIFHRH